MTQDRRTVLATIGLALPFGIDTRLAAASAPAGPAPVIRLRSFEEAVREAFGVGSHPSPVSGAACRRIEIGYSEDVVAGVQGCHNDRPFAGFPAGHLRIVRTGSGPGPIVNGVRLYVATVDVIQTGGRSGETSARPLNFAALPPAPTLSPAVPGAAKAADETVGALRPSAARGPMTRPTVG